MTKCYCTSRKPWGIDLAPHLFPVMIHSAFQYAILIKMGVSSFFIQHFFQLLTFAPVILASMVGHVLVYQVTLYVTVLRAGKGKIVEPVSILHKFPQWNFSLYTKVFT